MKLFSILPALALVACASADKVPLAGIDPDRLPGSMAAEYHHFTDNAAAVLTPAHLAECLDGFRQDVVDPAAVQLTSATYRIQATPVDFRGGRARMIVPIVARDPSGAAVRRDLHCHFRFRTLTAPEYAYAVAVEG